MKAFLDAVRVAVPRQAKSSPGPDWHGPASHDGIEHFTDSANAKVGRWPGASRCNVLRIDAGMNRGGGSARS